MLLEVFFPFSDLFKVLALANAVYFGGYFDFRSGSGFRLRFLVSFVVEGQLVENTICNFIRSIFETEVSAPNSRFFISDSLDGSICAFLSWPNVFTLITPLFNKINCCLLQLVHFSLAFCFCFTIKLLD